MVKTLSSLGQVMDLERLGNCMHQPFRRSRSRATGEGLRASGYGKVLAGQISIPLRECTIFRQI